MTTLSVSTDFLQQIGRVTVLQSHIEGQLAVFIRDLLRLASSDGDILTAQMSFGIRLKTVHSLLLSRLGSQHEYFKEFEAIQKDIARLEQARNTFVHSMWGFGSTLKSDTATRVKVASSSGAGARMQSVPVHIDELRELANEMEQREWAVSNLRVKVCHQGGLCDNSTSNSPHPP